MNSKVVKHAGPPTKLTDEMKQKLELIYQLDPTVEEVCYYCQISKQTVYNWKEAEPDLFDYLEQLRERPVVLARQSVIKAFETDPKLAMDYLARKRKAEFSNRQELTGPDGSDLFNKVSFKVEE